MRRRLLSIAIYALTTGIGVIAFLYPFILPSLGSARAGMAHTVDAPLVLTVVVGLCFIVMLLEVQGQTVNTKFVALLGVLVAMNSVLRFLEVALPGPGGISPVFFLIVMTGYVYGARLGFLMGALTMFVSALITGASGPWLPYQMFTASWIGMTAPVCRPLVRSVRAEGTRLEVVLLALFAALWGFIFGAIMNLWFWPYAIGPADQYWEAGIGVSETLKRYGTFYLATSFVWDILRAAGNLVLTLVFAAPTLRALRRFRRRFDFRHSSEPEIGDIPSTRAAMSRQSVEPKAMLRS